MLIYPENAAQCRTFEENRENMWQALHLILVKLDFSQIQLDSQTQIRPKSDLA